MSDSPAVSPLAPARFPVLPPVAGVRLAAHAAELRYRGRPDVMLAALAPGSRVAGVFTRSRCASAPVDWCRGQLARGTGTARAVLCNAGNANAFTGAAGEATVVESAKAVGEALGAAPEDVYLASTGVIGEPLSADAMRAAVARAADALVPPSPAQWQAAADAIRTTDTFPKGAGGEARLDGETVCVAAIAKGSGMIAPDMATMLAFAFTDADLPAPVLQDALAGAVDRSFNRITVDSDTSTSDTVLLFATGAVKPAVAPEQPIREASDPRLSEFRRLLDATMLDLAHQIVRDGEGARKFVEVTVEGAEDDAAARRIAFAIGNSPLVKTMLAAADANWGRLVMAVGKAGEAAERDRLRLWIGDEQCAEGGRLRDGYSEERATEHLRGDEVRLRADVGVGSGRATVWTCDLTHAYIDINAGYRS